jgi:hypothetical protein
LQKLSIDAGCRWPLLSEVRQQRYRHAVDGGEEFFFKKKNLMVEKST